MWVNQSCCQCFNSSRYVAAEQKTGTEPPILPSKINKIKPYQEGGWSFSSSCDNVSVHWRKKREFSSQCFWEQCRLAHPTSTQEPRKRLTSNMVNCVTPITNIIIFDCFEKFFWEYCAYLNHFIYYFKRKYFTAFSKN